MADLAVPLNKATTQKPASLQIRWKLFMMPDTDPYASVPAARKSDTVDQKIPKTSPSTPWRGFMAPDEDPLAPPLPTPKTDSSKKVTPTKSSSLFDVEF